MSTPGSPKGRRKARKVVSCVYGAPSATSRTSTHRPPCPSGHVTNSQFVNVDWRFSSACRTPVLIGASGVVVTRDRPEIGTFLQRHVLSVRDDVFLLVGEDPIDLHVDAGRDRGLLDAK